MIKQLSIKNGSQQKNYRYAANTFTKNAGFTLIELVVVIVIIGILAVTAAPRFLNLSDNARSASIKGLKSAVDGAVSLSMNKVRISGKDDQFRLTGSELAEIISGCEECTFMYGVPASDNKTIAALVDGVGLNFESDFATTNVQPEDSETYYIDISFSDNFEQSSRELTQGACAVRYKMTILQNVMPKTELIDCD